MKTVNMRLHEIQIWINPPKYWSQIGFWYLIQACNLTGPTSKVWLVDSLFTVTSPIMSHSVYCAILNWCKIISLICYIYIFKLLQVIVSCFWYHAKHMPKHSETWQAKKEWLFFESCHPACQYDNYFFQKVKNNWGLLTNHFYWWF